MKKKKLKNGLRLPKYREPVHPGEILSEEFMLPHDITQQEMSSRLKISRKHLIDIVHARKPLSIEIAQRLAKFFQTSLEFWVQGQMVYDLWHAKRNPSQMLKNIKPLKVSLN